MKTSMKKAAALLAAVMTMATVSGCGSSSDSSSALAPENSTAQTSSAPEESSEEGAETTTTTTAVTTTTTTTTEAPEELPDDSSQTEQPEAEPISNPNRAVVADCVLEQDDFMNFGDHEKNYIDQWFKDGNEFAVAIVIAGDGDASTYRDISVGSSSEQVLEAYGDSELVTLDKEDDLFYLFCVLRGAPQSYIDTIESSAGFYDYGGFLPSKNTLPIRNTAGLRFYVDSDGKVTAVCAYLNYYGLLSISYDDAGWSKLSGITRGNDNYSVRDTYLAPMCRIGRAAYSYPLDFEKPIPIYHFGTDGIITVDYDSSISTEAPVESVLDGASYIEEAPGTVKITLANGNESFCFSWNTLYGTYTVEDPAATDYMALLVPVVP